jgi:predicted 3-demethylubiquinone-9 3-methyltransferase (glyoxalase superfamily)
MQKITTFLWFNDNAEEAMAFYTSIFKNSRINWTATYGEAGPGPDDKVMTGAFTLDGQEFWALNGADMFKFSPAMSLLVSCENQEEVDYFWEKLSEGGKTNQCGWLDDKFGVTWQVVPKQMSELIHHSDPGVRNRVMQAMMKMTKFDVAAIEAAAKG